MIRVSYNLVNFIKKNYESTNFKNAILKKYLK